MFQTKLITLILCSGLLLNACSSAPATQYYQLPDSAYQLPIKNTPSVGVRIQLAEALQSNSLLYQTDRYTLNFARNNLWASSLSESLTNALSNKLNRLGSLKYLPANQLGQTHLTIYIDRFQGSYTGNTEISGYAKWQDGKQVPFNVQTAQYGDGYSAMLESLDKGLDGIAQQIAQ